MLAPDGRCKTFDASANGYVRSDGCGIVILKRLSDAKQDNNPILGLIRATSVNQDGASTGLTVPNGEAQEKLIQAGLEKAKLESKDVHYVEAHGTGTALGDPIEVKAIVATYGQKREQPLLIGSAKTNIGHTEAAAGIAGLLKCVLALQHEEIPKHLHFHQLNPLINLSEKLVEVVQTTVPWRRSETKRYAAISSFGFSGTNAHVIIEEAPFSEVTIDRPRPTYFLLTLSAKTEKALQEHILNFQKFLSETSEDIWDITYTANSGRTLFEHRIAYIGTDKKDFIQQLETSPHSFPIDSNLRIIADQFIKGDQIDWKEVYRESKGKFTQLPIYPFQRKRYWSNVIDKKKIKKPSGLEEVLNNPYDELGKALEVSPDKEKTVIDILTRYLKNILKISSDEPVNSNQGFFEMGMNSLMSVELFTQIQRAIGNRLTLRETITFEHPTIEMLAQYLLSALGYASVDAKKDAIQNEVENLSLDDLFREVEDE